MQRIHFLCARSEGESDRARKTETECVGHTSFHMCTTREREQYSEKVERECVGHTSLNVCTTREREH